jgi:hypothetical protein
MLVLLAEDLLTSLADPPGMRSRRPGNTRLFFDNDRMGASLSAVRADAVEPEVVLLAAITTGTALPIVGLPEIPAAAPALRMTVDDLGFVRLVSHQAAPAAATSIPIVLFVAGAPAAPAFAAVPIMMKNAL